MPSARLESWLPRCCRAHRVCPVRRSSRSRSATVGRRSRSAAATQPGAIGGIQQDGAYLGSPDAPVTITVFNDLQCAPAPTTSSHTIDPLIEQYARDRHGAVRVPQLLARPTETTMAAFAATAAGEQDREWQYVDLFFRNQDAAPAHTVSDEFLDDIGDAIPDFDLDAWRQARDSPGSPPASTPTSSWPPTCACRRSGPRSWSAVRAAPSQLDRLAVQGGRGGGGGASAV